MSDLDNVYAADDSEAEKAQLRESSLTASGILPTLKSPRVEVQDPLVEVKDGGGGAPGDGGDAGRERRGKKDILEFRPEARIWYLYLEDAEQEAKDRVELWKTGLDSLLIFAGLFAGIVSSFVIDARRDLLTNSEQNLLSDIRDTLRGMSVIDLVNIPVSQKWINGLWLMSLLITLFSAIMGVLAKAWLAKFVPATTRREATDAFHRYKLDKAAELWYLEEIITLVPLLVQIASFLFLGGLVVQSITDDQTLGLTLLGMCIAGCITYLTMTLLPLFVASSPFNTPLSDLLGWLGKMLVALLTLKWPSNSGWQVKTDINEGLAEILYTKLIKSPKPTYVDEAATEIALPSFKKNWIDRLCRNDTSRCFLTRFRQHLSTRTDNVIKRNEILCSHVLAFLQLVDHLEDKIATNPKEIPVEVMLPDYKHLLDALRDSLGSGYPLHRWNNLPESLRPLSFGLRTQILSLFKSLPECYRMGKDSTLIELDFNSNEMSDRPWELACQEIRSTHRLHFMLAACRGVLQGEKNVKTISAFILGLCLAKAGCSASETGRTSEWAGNIEAKERAIVDSLALEFLSQLYAATMNELEDMAAAALNDISSLSPGFEISAAHPRQGILETLFSTLTLPHRALRVHTIKMLNQVSDLKPDLFNTGSIEIISNMTVYEDEDIREDG
ncbi:hypothetical protein EST38_g14451, partial [Candolleomyces aberdarensis]